MVAERGGAVPGGLGDLGLRQRFSADSNDFAGAVGVIGFAARVGGTCRWLGSEEGGRVLEVGGLDPAIRACGRRADSATGPLEDGAARPANRCSASAPAVAPAKVGVGEGVLPGWV